MARGPRGGPVRAAVGLSSENEPNIALPLACSVRRGGSLAAGAAASSTSLGLLARSFGALPAAFSADFRESFFARRPADREVDDDELDEDAESDKVDATSSASSMVPAPVPPRLRLFALSLRGAFLLARPLVGDSTTPKPWTARAGGTASPREVVPFLAPAGPAVRASGVALPLLLRRRAT